MTNQHINGYALALLELSKEETKIELYKNDIDIILNVFEENSEYLNIISSQEIDMEVRLSLLEKSFKNIHKNLLNFLLLITKKNSSHLILRILLKTKKFINEELDIHEGIIYSINKLDQLEIDNITKKVVSISSFKKLILSNKIDKELLGGFKIVFDNKTIEDSITSRLENIKHQLIGKES